jgi:hypothetical protein
MAEDENEPLFRFLWRYKIWWMAPALSVAIIMALLLFLGRSTESSPFVYTIF